MGRYRLLGFEQQVLTYGKGIHVGHHKTAVGVHRCADDRFTANIEAGIDHDWASGQLIESRQHSMQHRVAFGIYCLDTC